MTDTIEQKALALVAEIRAEQGTPAPDYLTMRAALIRAIEQHEAFRQEVSDAIVFALKVYGGHRTALDPLRRFIIAKPDPLVEAVKDCQFASLDSEDYVAKKLRAAIEARGGKIVWGEG